MKKVSQIWFNIQGFLFPFIEKEIEQPLTEKLKQLVATLELIRIEDFVHIPDYWHGQSPKNRKQIARSDLQESPVPKIEIADTLPDTLPDVIKAPNRSAIDPFAAKLNSPAAMVFPSVSKQPTRKEFALSLRLNITSPVHQYVVLSE